MPLPRPAALSLLLLAAFNQHPEDPAPRPQPEWTARHEAKLEEARAHPPNLIFVGDSITQSLENPGDRRGSALPVWQRFYACRGALNLGFAGDMTGNALWRIENGEIDGIHPKLAVVLIGTNDIGAGGHATPQAAAGGVRAVVQTLHRKLPATRILVLGLLPRGRFDDARQDVNASLAQIDWSALGATYVTLDQVLQSGSEPDPALYREGGSQKPVLHPNTAGWTRIAEALEPRIAATLGPRPTACRTAD